jgi:hypothetical protein
LRLQRELAVCQVRDAQQTDDETRADSKPEISHGRLEQNTRSEPNRVIVGQSGIGSQQGSIFGKWASIVGQKFFGGVFGLKRVVRLILAVSRLAV